MGGFTLPKFETCLPQSRFGLDRFELTQRHALQGQQKPGVPWRAELRWQVSAAAGYKPTELTLWDDDDDDDADGGGGGDDGDGDGDGGGGGDDDDDGSCMVLALVRWS